MDKIRVLLVEDEPTLAMIIKDTLEGQNFTIHTAADGEEGLRKFFDLRPDVLVADVMMPRMDGFEMVRRIRQTDNFKHRHPVHTICLHRHRVALYARQPHTLNTCKHGKHFHFVLLCLQKVYHTHPAQASGKGKPPPKIIFFGSCARSNRARIRPLFIFARPIGCKSVNRGV